MSVRLENFDYSFSVTGTEGDLQWCSATFAPARPAEEETDAATAATQDVTDHYVGILDRLFAEDFLEGGRKPSLFDHGGSVDVGYDYKGSWRRATWPDCAPHVAARLSELFGIRDPDMRGDHCMDGTLSVALKLLATRPGEATPDPEVDVWCHLDHKLNTCLYRFSQSLDGIDVSDNAAEGMAALDRTLALDWDKAGQDWCKALLGSGAATSPGQEGSP